ncbi:MAG: MFS transporter [Myxococcota bacterium]|nr:MFS transporter [Myxococcota bacterium]
MAQGPTSRPSMPLIIISATFSRWILNVARRFAYPFAPALARGLGVPLTAITSMIALNQATAVVGIFLGPLIDKVGYRTAMLLSMTLFTVCTFAGGLLPFYGMILAALFIAGLSKTLFDASIQAYVGARVRFERRGLVVGLMEVAWAGSTLIGIPLIGLAIERYGWRSPFFALGIFGLACLLSLLVILGRNDAPKNLRSAKRPVAFIKTFRTLFAQRSIPGALGFAFFSSMANDSLFVISGLWLEREFGLSVGGIGLGAAIIGAAELAGEGLTAGLSDRLGLKRAIALGAGLATICYLITPLASGSLPSVLALLFGIFLSFEFSIVSYISLCTELAPASRATMMASMFSAAGLGRVLGALLGGPIWLLGGLPLLGGFCAVINTLGLVSLLLGLRRWR